MNALSPTQIEDKLLSTPICTLEYWKAFFSLGSLLFVLWGGVEAMGCRCAVQAEVVDTGAFRQ